MTDRELLELAAKAAGMEGWVWGEEDEYMRSQPKQTPYGAAHSFWNPLTDDGAALRLAVKLGMEVYVDLPDDGGGCTEAWSVLHDTYGKHRIIVGHEDDPYAATRKAIVRAAAEIGRGM